MTSGGENSGFRVEVAAPEGGRRGELWLPHGVVETPVFMPVGTVATVKAVAQDVLETNGAGGRGAQIILGNTYHLYLRPGHEVVRRMGGLHRFMSWRRPMLTDSGGFQVFSLKGLRKITDEGVEFRSHLDGSRHFFSPEHSMAVQIALGADVMMAFDECVETPATRERTRASMDLTHAWAARSKAFFEAHREEVPWFAAKDGATQRLFGIVQGGMYADLRRESAERLVEMDFPGYAIGGLAVGEPREVTREMIARTLEWLPRNKPRYVMGVGYPDEIEEYARMGVDMMDCVLPTRAGRHGLLFTREAGTGQIVRLNIRKKEFAEDQGPIDADCTCMVCGRYTRAYLRHLYAAGEPLSAVLNSIHNLAFYLDTMERVRGKLRGLLFCAFFVLAGSLCAQTSTVPFVGCPSDGQLGPMPAPHGRPRQLAIPGEAAAHLAWFEAKNAPGVLAPRDWHCFGGYGSNGSTLYVTPGPISSKLVFTDGWTGFSGPAIEISSISGSTSGRFEVARRVARLFPAHMDFVRQVIGEGMEPASDFPQGPYPDDKTIYKTETLVEFETPPFKKGLGTDSRLQPAGLPIRGFVFLSMRPNDDPYDISLEMRLSPDLARLAAIIELATERALKIAR